MQIWKRLEDITAADILELVEQRVRESRFLDYKGTYNFKKGPDDEREKNELRKDVAALANAAGGHLVIGVIEEEVDGRRTGYPGQAVGIANAEDLRRAVTAVLRVKIDPPVEHAVRLVEGFPNGACLVIHVPRSFRMPHMVVETRRFPRRVGEETVDMDATQLREAFLLSESFGERARTWVANRLAAVSDGAPGTPRLLGDDAVVSMPHLIMHVASFDAVSGNASDELVRRAAVDAGQFLPFGMGANSRRTFDGVLLAAHASDSEADGYTLVFRNGWIESATTLQTYKNFSEHYLPMPKIERVIVDQTVKLLAEVALAAHAPPYFVFLTFRRVEGLHIPNGPHAFDRRSLALPEVVFEDPPALATPQDRAAAQPIIARALRPAFDLIAQACGLDCSSSFDASGAWAPR